MIPGDYARRAAWYAIEIAEVARPRFLYSLLESGPTVAEVPSGVGHFLDDYATAQTTTPFPVTLIDAEPLMLAGAARRAADRHLTLRTMTLMLGTETTVERFDLVVCPNAAFNYLVETIGPHEAATSLAALVAPKGVLMLQVLLRHPDGRVDRCGCYDPAAGHGRWFTEWTRPDHQGGWLTRRRWQRRTGDIVEVRFARHHSGQGVSDSSITMRILDQRMINNMFAGKGLRREAVAQGTDQLSEIVLRQDDNESAP